MQGCFKVPIMSDGHGNRLTPQQRVALIAAVSAAAMQLRCKPPLEGELMSGPLASLAHKLLREQAESVWGLPACSEWIPPKSATSRIRFWWSHFINHLNVKPAYKDTKHKKKYDITDDQLRECISRMNDDWHPTILDAVANCKVVHDLIDEVS